MNAALDLIEAAGYLIVAFSVFVFLLCGVGSWCDHHIPDDRGGDR